MNATNEILLRRKHFICAVPKNTKYVQNSKEKALVISALKNIQPLGFTFSQALIETLFHFSKSEFEAFYFELIPELKKLVAADVKYTPMYPNFPKQVAEADEVELFINAIIHYWSFGTLIPEYKVNERMPLIDDNEMTVLSIGNHADLMEIFANLVSSKTSLSAQDKEDVTTIIKECTDYSDYLPDEIPLKENVALVGKLIIEEAPVKSSKYIEKYFKTATDVLRLVTAMSNGDISLAANTKYRNMKRRERRMIMDLLANCGNITEDLFRYHCQWIRVAEIIHPGEYKAPKYQAVLAAFNTLRNERKPLMFGGKVQEAILAKDMKAAAEMLKERPGEFARKLDKLIRDSKNPNYIVNCFKDIANEVSTPVLIQVRQHFIGRMSTEKNDVRVFFPKGNLAKAMVIENELADIDENVCNNIARICRNAIVEQYKEKEFMGNVYVSEELKNYLIPFSQRSASKSTKTFVRGSKIGINKNAEAVRAFIWWTNTDIGRVDIDLSAAIFDENWNYVECVSYTKLRCAKYRAYHSGDITNGGPVDGDGSAEFLDVDIDAVAKNAGRYIVYQVYSFTGGKFSELPNCRFGWMERRDVNSGEIFEPKTVQMKMDLTTESTIEIPVIFDCVERKFIWCDMNIAIGAARRNYGGNNLESNLRGVNATCYGMTHLNKANIYDLIIMNVQARGTLVSDRNKADIIFDNDTTKPVEVVNITKTIDGIKRVVGTETREKDVPIITATDTEYFAGQLL